jgi:uroporphyrinogen-III synthase
MKRLLTILNTRPTNPYSRLSQALAAEGILTHDCPLITIEPIAPQTPMPPHDITLFLSQHAVIHSRPYWPSPFPATQHLAIGPATQAALHAEGLRSAHIPNHFSSAGLLAMKALTHCDDQRCLIISGHDSQPMLTDTLSLRGAIVYPWPCYRRVNRSLGLNEIQQLHNDPPDLILVTSNSLLSALMLAAPPEQLARTIPLLTISPAMTVRANTLGWTTVHTAHSAHESEVIAAILQWQQSMR